MRKLGPEVLAGLRRLAELDSTEQRQTLARASALLSSRKREESEISEHGELELAAASFLLEAAGAADARQMMALVSGAGPEVELLVKDDLLPEAARLARQADSHVANLERDALAINELVDVRWSLEYKVRGSALTGAWQMPIFFVELLVCRPDTGREECQKINIMYTRAQLESFVAKLADALAQAKTIAATRATS